MFLIKDHSLPHLLHHQFGRRHSDGDAHIGQFVQDVLEVQIPAGLCSREGAALQQRTESESNIQVLPDVRNLLIRLLPLRDT